jgi:predicted GIY-YIG superfamily endonuclease
MKTTTKIIRQIEAYVKQKSTIIIDYKRWYIGVTNNPSIRKSQHKSLNNEEPYFWKHWYCYSKENALTVEKYFHKKGMLNTSKQGGTAENSKYVYVYKKYPTLID